MHSQPQPNAWRLAGGRSLPIGLLVLVLVSLWATALLAQENGYNLSWFSIDGGSQAVSGGGYELRAAIGQPDAGTLSAGPYVLHGGFFRGGAEVGQDSIFVFLPVVESSGAASSAQSVESDDPALFLPSIQR
jgi:hypothetical protein